MIAVVFVMRRDYTTTVVLPTLRLVGTSLSINSTDCRPRVLFIRDEVLLLKLPTCVLMFVAVCRRLAPSQDVLPVAVRCIPMKFSVVMIYDRQFVIIRSPDVYLPFGRTPAVLRLVLLDRPLLYFTQPAESCTNAGTYS